MQHETKTVQGTLEGLEGRESTPNVTVKIRHQPESDAHKFIVTLTIPAYKPDLDEVMHNLKLGDVVEGHALLILAGSPSEEATDYVVSFHDDHWKEDWFSKL